MLELKYPYGFFHGATTLKIDGASILLGINPIHSFKIKLGCGNNTNTRAELLALWVLLYFVDGIGIPSLHVYGDSSIVIN